MKTKLLFSLWAIFFLSIYASSAQTVFCGGTFTDPAGPTTNYANSSNYTETICPNNLGEFVTVTFTAFDTESTWDGIYVYNGNSITAPQIASSNPVGNANGPLSTPGAFWGTTIPGPFTSSSADGCLTFRFMCDAVVTRAGWIADVTCAPMPTCPRPTALVSSNITTTSATLSWTETGIATAWEILVLPSGSPTPTPSSTGWIEATTNPFVLTGLLPNTCYNYYVRAVCDVNDISLWSLSGSFCTMLAAPECGGTFVDNGGPNAFYANGSDNTYVICPTNVGEQVTVTFTSYDTEATWDGIYVFDGNSISAPQIASTNPVGNTNGPLSTPGAFWGTTIPGPFTSSSNDGCLTFRFRSDPSVNRAGWLANVTCGPPPTCPKPNTLTLTSVTTTSVTLGWTNNSIASTWEYLVLPTGSPAPTDGSIGVLTTSNPVIISGLSPNTCYVFYVRAICSETDKSFWSTSANICTLIEPPVCGGLFVDNGGANVNYINNADNTYVVCPTTPGEVVTVAFNTFDTETSRDALYVFDGNSIMAPQISSTNSGGNVPGGLAGGYWGTTVPGPFISSSADGCLTFRFRSDNANNRAGWNANVTCGPATDKIVLLAFIDQNNNGIKDSDELLFSNGSFMYQINDIDPIISGYSPAGRYVLYDSNTSNSYDFSYEIQPEFTSFYSASTTTYTNVSIAPGSGTQTLYFPVVLTQPYSDVVVAIVPINPPRPGQNYINRIIYRNQGQATANGLLTFAKPSQATISTTSQTGTVTNVSGFTYNFTNLLPNEIRSIDVTMNLAATVAANELVTNSATITGVTNDIDNINNTYSNSQIAVNSYDPNNKMEAHGDKINYNTFNLDEYLHYTIRFQNLGTASAINISITDVLNAKLDETSVRMEGASQSCVMDRVGNQLTWNFKNIYLPSATVNASGSTGYVQFKVKVKPGLQAGNIVPNNASIYFDTNPAVVTNTFNIKFIAILNTVSFDNGSLIIYPNPASNLIHLNITDSSELFKSITLYNILGGEIKSISNLTSNQTSVDISDLAKGVYFVEIKSQNNLKLIKKLIIE